MSIDLTLLVIWPENGDVREPESCVAQIDVNRDARLYSALRNAPRHPFPFGVYCDFADEPVTEDRDGKMLEWISAGEFVRLMEQGDRRGDLSAPAFAYIAALRPDAKIGLYWSS